MKKIAVILSILGFMTYTAFAQMVWHSAMDGGANALVGDDGVQYSYPVATEDMNGNPDGAVWFDGTNDYFRISKQVSRLTAGTISAWVRADRVQGEEGPVAVGASGSTSADRYFSFQANALNNKWRVDVDDGTNRMDVYSNSNPTTNEWQHIVTTFTAGGTLKLYVDGVLQNSQRSLSSQSSDGFEPTLDWVVGAERIGTRCFQGAIDDVRIYTNELDQSEVTALYNDGPLYNVLFNVGTTRNFSGSPSLDTNLITVSISPDVIGPATSTEWKNTGALLPRFDNLGWDGFSLAAYNGTNLVAGEFSSGYHEFTISAPAGHRLNLDSLIFNSARGGDSGYRRYELYAAVNGAAISFGDTPISTIDNETGTRPYPRPVYVDLSGESYQEVKSITFRYYPLTDSSGQSMEFDGMTLSGDVVEIPKGTAILFK